MGCGQESFKLVWRCHQILCRFLVKGHFPGVDKGDNEMIPGVVHRSPVIYFIAQEKLPKTSARRPSMKAVRRYRFKWWSLTSKWGR